MYSQIALIRYKWFQLTLINSLVVFRSSGSWDISMDVHLGRSHGRPQMSTVFFKPRQGNSPQKEKTGSFAFLGGNQRLVRFCNGMDRWLIRTCYIYELSYSSDMLKYLVSPGRRSSCEKPWVTSNSFPHFPQLDLMIFHFRYGLCVLPFPLAMRDPDLSKKNIPKPEVSWSSFAYDHLAIHSWVLKLWFAKVSHAAPSSKAHTSVPTSIGEVKEEKPGRHDCEQAIT